MKRFETLNRRLKNPKRVNESLPMTIHRYVVIMVDILLPDFKSERQNRCLTRRKRSDFIQKRMPGMSSDAAAVSAQNITRRHQNGTARASGTKASIKGAVKTTNCRTRGQDRSGKEGI